MAAEGSRPRKRFKMGMCPETYVLTLRGLTIRRGHQEINRMASALPEIQSYIHSLLNDR
jgi:hypothetical protein